MWFWYRVLKNKLMGITAGKYGTQTVRVPKGHSEKLWFPFPVGLSWISNGNHFLYRCAPPHSIKGIPVGQAKHTFLLKINIAHATRSKIATRNCSWTPAHSPCGLSSRWVRHTLTPSWNNTNMKSVCGHSVLIRAEESVPSKNPQNTWPCTVSQHLTSHVTRSPCSSKGQVAADERASYITQCPLPPALLRCLASLATRRCWMHLI